MQIKAFLICTLENFSNLQNIFLVCKLEELAEFSAAHEIILLSFDLAHGPDTDGGHAGEVDKEYEVISEIHKAQVSS